MNNTGQNTNLWQQNYDDVCAYLSEHNCDLNGVPDSAVFRTGKKMKRWLYEMRKSYMGQLTRYTLNAAQKKLLKKIGIERLLSVTDRDWYLHFNDLLVFYKSNHHLKIPADMLTSDGKNLKSWTNLQRKHYRDNVLPEKYIDEFERHGIIEVLETPLDTAMRHVEEYYREHGNIDFDTGYVCPDGYQLGTWLRTFRDRVAKQRNKKPFPPEIIDRLNEMGMIWNKTEYVWKQTYRKLKAYIETHGIQSLPPDLRTENGTKIKTWVTNNKNAYRDGKLTEEKMKLLDEIGLNEISFEPPPRSEPKPKTADKKQTQKAKAISKTEPRAPTEKILKQPSAGTGRKEIRRQQWYQNVELCRKYIEKNGTTFSPDMLSVNGDSLKNWVNLNRSRYKRGKLSPERAAALETIGITEISFRKPTEQRKKRTGRPHKKPHPKLPAEKRKMHLVSLRISEEEFTELKLAAEQQGYKYISEYIRSVILCGITITQTEDGG